MLFVSYDILFHINNTPDSKVHGANAGPTWVLSAPDGPHIGPVNLAIRDIMAFGNENFDSSWQNLGLDGILMAILLMIHMTTPTPDNIGRHDHMYDGYFQ